jgi:hypothetical protein
MDERVDAEEDHDDEATPLDMPLPDAETQPWRPFRQKVIVGLIVAVVVVLGLNGVRVWKRYTSDCDLPLWVYCINCPKLSEVRATADRSPVGPFTEVNMRRSMYTGETAYFNSAGRLVAAAEWEDTSGYCSSAEPNRWFGQRFFARPDDEAETRSQHKRFPTPQGAEHWR